jgi:uncharacterized protein with PIN domain
MTKTIKCPHCGEIMSSVYRFYESREEMTLPDCDIVDSADGFNDEVKDLECPNCRESIYAWADKHYEEVKELFA